MLGFFSFKVEVKVLHVVGKDVQAVKASLLPWVCADGNSSVKGNFKLTQPSHFSDHF